MIIDGFSSQTSFKKDIHTYPTSADFIPTTIYLNIHGLEVSVQSSFRFVIDQLRLDFGFFETDEISQPQIEIEISCSREPTKKGFPYPIPSTLNTKSVQSSWNRRLITFKEDVELEIVDQPKITQATIYSLDPYLAYEISFITLNSLMGSALESIGILRLHAAALKIDNSAFIVFGRPGAGKSFFVQEAVKKEAGLIYGDETVFINVKNDQILPFPIRVSQKKEVMSEKSIPAHLFKTRILSQIPPQKVAPPCKWDYKALALFNLKPQSKASWYFEILMGIGLMQIHEIAIRPKNLRRLAKTLFYRIRFLLKIKSIDYLTRDDLFLRFSLESFGLLKKKNP